MLWFSHDCDARHDKKLLKLRLTYGAEGYAFYFYCLELLGDEEKAFVLDYSVAHDFMMKEDRAKELGYEPLGYVRAYTYVGLDPRRMGLGPAMSIPRALDKAGMALKDIELIETDLKSTTPWFNDIFTKDVDKLSLYLKENGIGTRRVYPPANSQKAYNIPGNFSVTESYANRGLWLPSSLKLTDEDVEHVCNLIKEFYNK